MVLVVAGGREPPFPPDVRALQQVRGPVRRRRGDVPAGRRHLAPALRARAARPARRRRPARRPHLLRAAGTHTPTPPTRVQVHVHILKHTRPHTYALTQ